MKVLRGTWIVTLSLVITGACGESDDEGAFEANGDGSTNCPVGQIGCPCTKGRTCNPPGQCDIPRFRCIAEDAAGGTAGAAGTGGSAGASGGAAGVDARRAARALPALPACRAVVVTRKGEAALRVRAVPRASAVRTRARTAAPTPL